MLMPAMALGGTLAGLGVGSYFATGRKSVTALIPFFFGLLFLALGWLGSPGGLLDKVALGLAVLGVAGTAGGLIKLVRGAGGAAVIAKAAMATLCLIYILLWLL